MVLNASDPHGSQPSAPGHPGLYGLFWRFAGDACVVQPDIANMARGACTLHTYLAVSLMAQRTCSACTPQFLQFCNTL